MNNMSKRVPQVDVPVLDKKVKTKSKKPAPVVLTGHEKTVDVLASKKAEIEAAGKVIDHTRITLDPIVTAFRNGCEAKGDFTKSIQVKGSKANAVYTYKDSYAKIDVSVESNLKSLLGANYGKLFDRKKTCAVKTDEQSMAKLKELAKVHGFLDLLTEDEFLVPVSDFRTKRYEMREELSSAQNKVLDDVVVQVSAQPSLSFK